MALTDETKQSIITALTSTSLSESFIEMVLNRLDSFGYEVKEEDAWMIGFEMQKVENHIKNECNISEIPEGLIQVAVDMVCGEFLLQLISLGKLNDIQITQTLSSVKLGDTTVSYSTSGAVDKVALFTGLMNDLIHGKEGELVCYRKMHW